MEAGLSVYVNEKNVSTTKDDIVRVFADISVPPLGLERRGEPRAGTSRRKLRGQEAVAVTKPNALLGTGLRGRVCGEP